MSPREARPPPRPSAPAQKPSSSRARGASSRGSTSCTPAPTATTRARRLTSQVRTARKVGDRAELFARGTYLRNTFAGIDQSLDGAAGVTALLLQGEPQRLSFDSGFGYIGEDRTRGGFLIFSGEL